MKIQKIPNTNFGRMSLVKVGVANNTILSFFEQRQVKSLVKCIDEISGDDLNVFASIRVKPEFGDFNVIKLTTYPTHRNMDVLKYISSSATPAEYRQKSKWVILKLPNLNEELGKFVEGQKKYIDYCLMNVEHRKNIKAPPANSLPEGVSYQRFTDLYC